MVPHPFEEPAGVDADRQQSAGLRGDGHAGRGVGVKHTCQVVPCFVDRAVDHVSGDVDRVRCWAARSAGQVNLHEVLSGDRVISQPVGGEEDVPLRARHRQGDVAINRFGPSQVLDHVVCGRQSYPECPLFRGHA